MGVTHFDGISSKTGGYAVGIKDEEIYLTNRSGHILSGFIASGALQYGCFASGSIRTGSLYSGALAAGGCASGAINFPGALVSGVVQVGAIYSGALAAGGCASGAINFAGAFASGVVAAGAMASGAITSGRIADFTVGRNIIAQGLRYDGGSVGVSGEKLSVSTAISSILMAQATLAISGVNNSCHFALVGWSGHCIDIDLIALNASGIIVGNYSSKVNWFVMGN